MGNDLGTLSIVGHAASELLLAFNMSLINAEQMGVMRAASKAGKSAGEAGKNFLFSPYYRSWSRAQLNNTEYAPMLALLVLCLKYKSDKEKRELTFSEKCASIGSVIFSYIFIYAVATQGRLDRKNLSPGAGGMSPLRPLGAMGRYAMMGWLIYLVARR